MPIIVNLDVMMAKRKISSNELSEKIGKPAYDGFAYGHIPVSHAIDFRRKLSVAEDGTMTWE